ncbi:protein rep [Vibrio crassostreae]|uniref:protein rep n=1 Tax=Vibrio crassostreae TaxID=246167 RepID=UPI001B31215F|nr:protein rep [Vibrio crassostreae]
MCKTDHKIRSADQGENRPLGIIAKSSAPLVSEGMQQTRRERLKYQRVAATILGVDAQKELKKKGIFKNPDPAKNEHFESSVHRVCGCMWTAIASNVLLARSKEFGTGHVKNVATCGSVWVCPVCTARVQERRREEIAKAMNAWYKQGGQVIMVTLTAPHYNGQKLKDLRAMQAEALAQLRKSSGAYKRFLTEKQGFEGLIRALEVTVGRKNGWHLHTHELWFVKGDADVEKIKERTLDRWENACYRAGLLNAFDPKQVRAFRRRAVDIKGAVSCSEYLAKMDDAKHWGADREVAKQSTKQGKKSGYHPFGLLAEVADEGKDASWAKVRFAEYAKAMKGARQLYWSPGLKAKFEIDEKTDEEVANEHTDSMERLRFIPNRVWYEIAKLGWRARLLETIELNNKHHLDDFIRLVVRRIRHRSIEEKRLKESL